MNSEEILKNVENVLKEEGFDFGDKKTNSEILEEFILPGLKNSKDILQSIYSFQIRSRSGVLGKLKTGLQNKIINTCINVIEKQSMKQQKFNELTFRAIETLVKENKELRERLQSSDKIRD